MGAKPVSLRIKRASVNGVYVNTRGIDLVKNLWLMNVTQRRDYFTIIMMFKSIHGLVPD